MSSRDSMGSTEIEGPRKTTTYEVDSITANEVKLLSAGAQDLELPQVLFPLTPRKGHKIKISIAIEDPHTHSDWARAFAMQGKSDLDMYELLCAHEKKEPASVPSCHRLHYLQMATEKIAKAYQVGAGRLSPRKKSHVAAEEFVKNYYNSPTAKLKFSGKDAHIKEVKTEMLEVARKIEILAPAVDQENAPANVEYPWPMHGNLEIPCQHKFDIENVPAHRIKQFVTMLRDIANER